METDAASPVLLPKGIVTNSTTIYQEVASYSTIPADRIFKYWHVYTTTNKKLQDPTARRLENFWWQVWGSDRRNLSGRALAQIFEHISLGPTVVPLRRPRNSLDGLESIAFPLPAISVLPQASFAPGTTVAAAGPHTGAATGTSLRRPPLNPVMKKDKNPAATKAASQPLMPRMKDFDQASGGFSGQTDVPGVHVGYRASERHKGKAPQASHTLQPATERSLQNNRSHVKSFASSRSTSGVGSRSNDTRNARSTQPPSVFDAKGSSQHTSDSSRASSVSMDSKTILNPTVTGDQISGSAKPYMAKEAHQRARKAVHETAGPPYSPQMRRSQSNNSTDSIKASQSNRPPPQPSFRGATSSTTKIAAQGTIIEESGNNGGTSLSASSVLNDPEYSGFSAPHNSSATSLLDSSRFTPTQPSTFASLPLGRTKSQLTLLLERGKDRGSR